VNNRKTKEQIEPFTQDADHATETELYQHFVTLDDETILIVGCQANDENFTRFSLKLTAWL